MGLASAGTLGRLTDLILERHPSCGDAAELLRISCEDGDAIEHMERILGSDDRAHFSSRMDRLERSPFGRRFRSLADGAHELGCRPVLSAAVAITTVRALDGDAPHLDRVRFWRHATATGMLTLVGANLDHAHEDGAFAAGFFSSIGRLMLDRFAPEMFGEALALAASEHMELRDAIAEVFGFPDTELAAALAIRWHMPVWAADAIAFPVRASEAGAQAHTLAGLVFRAELVARARGFGGEGEGLEVPPDRLRWLTDPLLTALDRIGGNAWLEARIGGILALAPANDPPAA